MNIKQFAAVTIAATSLLTACGRSATSQPDQPVGVGASADSVAVAQAQPAPAPAVAPTEVPSGGGVRQDEVPAPVPFTDVADTPPELTPIPAPVEVQAPAPVEVQAPALVEPVQAPAPVEVQAPAPAESQPTRVGEWSLDPGSGLWVHDSGTLAFEDRGSGVLYDLAYGYAVDYNTGLVYDPASGQWVDPATHWGQGSSGDWSDDGAGWSYQTYGDYFGYGASDGTTTGFSFDNGCTVLDGQAMC